MSRTSVMFISHGSPLFALDPGQLGPNLQDIGQSLHKVDAVLVVSPHWQTKELLVSGTSTPETIHDFTGFPAPL